MGSEPPSLQQTCRRGNVAGKIPDPLLLIGDPAIVGGTVLNHAELPHALQDILHTGPRSLSVVVPPSYCDSQKLPSPGKPNKPGEVPPPITTAQVVRKRKWHLVESNYSFVLMWEMSPSPGDNSISGVEIKTVNVPTSSMVSVPGR